MIRIKPDIIENKQLVDERFSLLVRKRFLEIFVDTTGKKPASDFTLIVNNTGGKIIINLEVGKGKTKTSLTKTVTEGEFRNRVSEDEFFDRDNSSTQSEQFKSTMDRLMSELPGLMKKAQDK